MLHWSNLPFADKVIVFYGTSGIYTWYGMTGIVFGVIVPLCLFFVAACIKPVRTAKFPIVVFTGTVFSLE
jgi:hypothetical protein